MQRFNVTLAGDIDVTVTVVAKDKRAAYVQACEAQCYLPNQRPLARKVIALANPVVAW